MRGAMEQVNNYKNGRDRVMVYNSSLEISLTSELSCMGDRDDRTAPRKRSFRVQYRNKIIRQ